ncbi:MAG: efflux RND transporter permease subunit [Clostridiales bacterium]|nr:efflux RND transporter permease subunit [Clostridiales bacterium]
MEKFSVKKPFTVLVAVIAIIALGAVSIVKLPLDLLPEFSLPYLIVITAYPGASPEKIEDQVSKPIENSLGTVSGVVNVSSTSSDSYSIVQLEFADDTDMNVAMVRVTSALNDLESSLPAGVMTPNIMEISLDMLATMYIAVERDDYDIYELTDFVNNDVVPYLSRQEGVASITTIGLVEKSIQVELNQDKIDALNERILRETNNSLADAQDQLDEAQEALDEAQSQLENAQSNFGNTMSSAIFSQIDGQAGGIADSLRENIDLIVSKLDQVEQGMIGIQNVQNAALSGSQSSVDAARANLDRATAFQIQLRNTLDEAQSISDRAREALERAASDPDFPPDEYNALVEADAIAAANLIAAQIAYDAGSAEVAAAQAAFDEANNALINASLELAGITPQEMTNLINDIDSLRNMFSQSSSTVNGSTAADLINTTRNLSSLMSQLSSVITRIRAADPAGSLNAQLVNLESQLQNLRGVADSIPEMLNGIQSGVGGITQGQLNAAVQFSTAAVGISDAQTALDQAQAQYDAAHESALESANADALIDPDTLSQLIYAQNFSMPVGYIDDANDQSWLLRVGEEFTSAEDIASALLLDNDTIGTVRLEDIADIVVIDTADDSYTKLNGSDGIILCIFKSSSAGTNEVSGECNDALAELSEMYPGFHSINLVDQGVYINMIIESVFQSMLIGALLAIIILALFLKDVKPTIVVAISIPLSVLFAIVLMYFTGLELNMMTLSGLALGIGMLVDNSVVVMENIFRLIGRGVPAPRAAVQGAKQVRGSIIASTLTTICVFFPAVFAKNMVRTLMFPLALSIGYCLVASLIMALTVVPASCSTLLSKSEPKEHKLFDKTLDVYGKSLRWCLKHKAAPLAVSVGLLAFAVVMVFRTGIVYIPEITTNEITIDITTPEEMTREESYAKVDEVMDMILSVDGVEDLGIMDSGSSSSFLMSGMSSDSYGQYMCYALAPENASHDQMERISEAIEAATAESGCEVVVSTSSAMGDSSMLTGSSGISVIVSGNDYEQLRAISEDVGAILASQEGIVDVTDSFADGEPTLQVVIDRDKAMEYGLTVAQIYAGIASHTASTVDAVNITVDGTDMTVTIVDNTDELTRENLMDIEFEAVDMAAMSGSSAGSYGGASAGAFSGASSGSFDSLADMFGVDLDEETTADGEEGTEADADVEEEESNVHTLSEFATVVETETSSSINRENLVRYVTVSSSMAEGYNATLVSRELAPKIEEYERTVPDGYSVEISGESEQVNDLVKQMLEMAALALLFIYLVMVAQFQSLLSPFIILFTIPLAFTGGMIGLLIAGEPLSMLSMLGFVILMGTVVNNGIVFVDYTNQLRIGGLERREALVATGKTRMRPILMTALTTILAMSLMIFGTGMSSQLGRGMSIVIAGGLLYATFMTLYIVPVMYDILFKRPPVNVDVGSDTDEVIDDAAEYLEKMGLEKS